MSLLLLLACTAGGPRPSPSPGTDTGATDSAGRSGGSEAGSAPISAGTYTAVADLPPWTDHPMAGR